MVSFSPLSATKGRSHLEYSVLNDHCESQEHLHHLHTKVEPLVSLEWYDIYTGVKKGYMLLVKVDFPVWLRFLELHLELRYV